MINKVSFKNSRNLTLVGSHWPASSSMIIIMPHASGSNRIARGLFEKIALSLQKENYNVLTFDFSGHGESEYAVITLKKAVDDVTSAIAYVKVQGYERVALFGHSLGAFACLKAFTPVETMVLLGAVSGPVHWKWEEMCSPVQLNDLRKHGYVTADVNDGLRNIVNIDGKLLQEILEIDQETLLQHVACPVLFIHGDADKQELDLVEFSKKALNLLPQNSQLHIIKGASHLFIDHVHEVVELTKKWYLRYFPINFEF